jgi:hypothetical protein
MFNDLPSWSTGQAEAGPLQPLEAVIGRPV